MKQKGFTLIELLVVISIIGLLASIALVSLNSARAKGRDARRLTDIRQLVTALALYHDANGEYPVSDGQGCGGWDTPGDGDFISALRTSGYLSTDVKDPISDDNCANWRYYRYSAGDYGCNAARGNFYVLGIYNLESGASGSPGWNCPSRDWQSEMEWVTGAYEK